MRKNADKLENIVSLQKCFLMFLETLFTSREANFLPEQCFP